MTVAEASFSSSCADRCMLLGLFCISPINVGKKVIIPAIRLIHLAISFRHTVDKGVRSSNTCIGLCGKNVRNISLTAGMTPVITRNNPTCSGYGEFSQFLCIDSQDSMRLRENASLKQKKGRRSALVQKFISLGSVSL